jgi:hypothetical protein
VVASTAQTQEQPIRSAWRWAGFAGVAWFVAFIVGGVVLQGEPPAYNEPIAEVRDFFADDGQRYLVGDYIVNIAFVLLLLPLIVGLRGWLGAAEDGAQIGSRPAAQRPRSWMPSRLPQAEPSSRTPRSGRSYTRTPPRSPPLACRRRC